MLEQRDLFEADVTSAEALRHARCMGAGPVVFGGNLLSPYLFQQQAEDWMYDQLGVLDSDVTGFIQKMNVNCADNALPLLTLEGANARLGDAYERSPLFASQLMPEVSCNGWTVASDPVAPLTAPGAPPLLVIGGSVAQAPRRAVAVLGCPVNPRGT